MIYDAVVQLLGTPPAGLEWLAYVASIFIGCTLISSISTLVLKIMRIPFRGR